MKNRNVMQLYGQAANVVLKIRKYRVRRKIVGMNMGAKDS